MNRIKAFFIKKAVKNQVNKNRDASLPDSNVSMNVIVLLNDSQQKKIPQIKELLNQGFSSSKYYFLVPDGQQKQLVELENECHFIGKDDFSLTGQLKNTKINELLALSSELFLNLTNKPSLIENYLYVFSMATFKVGFKPHTSEFSDLFLQLDINADEIDAIDAFGKYLLKLNGLSNE